jgi:hypothetical protein
MRTLRVLRAFGPLLVLASLLGGSRPAEAQAFSDPGSGFGVFAAFAQPSTSGQARPQAGLLFRSRLTGGLGVELGASYRATTYAIAGEDLLRLSTVPVTVTIQVFPSRPRGSAFLSAEAYVRPVQRPRSQCRQGEPERAQAGSPRRSGRRCPPSAGHLAHVRGAPRLPRRERGLGKGCPLRNGAARRFLQRRDLVRPHEVRTVLE